MSKVSTVYAFLDTNFFLHHEWFCNVDWRKALGAKKVCLVVAPIVHDELNKFKDDRTNGRRRNRSRDTLAEFKRMGLKELRHGVSVRDRGQVSLRLLATKPDMSQYPDLQKDHQDDQLVGAALSFQDACDPGDKVVIVTGDGPLTISADAHGLGVFDADHLRLPDEKDEATRRIEELERENRRLRHAEPQLSLSFASAQGPTQTRHIKRFVIPARSPQEINRRVAEEAAAIKAVLPADFAVPSLEPVRLEVDRMDDPGYMAAINMVSERNRQNSPYHDKQYQEKAQSYLKEYAEYLQNVETYADRHARATSVTFLVDNDGTSAAQGVHITVAFPDGFQLCDKGDLPNRPAKPKRPSMSPPSMVSILAAMGSTPSLDYLSRLSSSRFQVGDENIGPFFSRTAPNQVTYRFQQLIHGITLTLNPFMCIFPPDWNDTVVPITYNINVGNKVDAVTGMLEIMVDETRSIDAMMYAAALVQQEKASGQTS